MSASREQLLLMLYEAAIKYMKRAKLGIQKKDISMRGQNIGFACDIVMELTNTLDHNASPKIAANLDSLYAFVSDRLVHANIHGDEKSIDESIKVFQILYEGWQEAVEKLKADQKKAG